MSTSADTSQRSDAAVRRLVRMAGPEDAPGSPPPRAQSPLSRAALAAPLLLRLVVGIGFLMHGYAKLSRGPEAFAGVLGTLGVPAPLLLAWLTTLVELVGGIAVLFGAYVSIVAVPMTVVLLTAMIKVHLAYGFFSVKLAEVSANGIRFGSVGVEIILLYLAALAAIALGGAGPWSVDAWRRRDAGAGGAALDRYRTAGSVSVGRSVR